MKEGFALKNVRKGFQVFLIGEGGIFVWASVPDFI